MTKALLITGIVLNIFSCEKPFPQQPKIISSSTYKEAILKDSVDSIKLNTKDSISNDSVSKSNLKIELP